MQSIILMQGLSFVVKLRAMEHRNTGSSLYSSNVLNILKYYFLKGCIVYGWNTAFRQTIRKWSSQTATPFCTKASSLRFCLLKQLPNSNSVYNTVLLNKISFRRSFICKGGGQFTVTGTLLSLTKVTNPCIFSEESF